MSSTSSVDIFLSLLVDCICLDIRLLQKKGASARDEDLNKSFTGFILSTVCSSFASSESTNCIAAFQKHAMRLLELYSEVMKAQQKIPPLQTWLSGKFRWLLIFVASATKCLLTPQEALNTPSLQVRGLYACGRTLSPAEVTSRCLGDRSSR